MKGHISVLLKQIKHRDLSCADQTDTSNYWHFCVLYTVSQMFCLYFLIYLVLKLLVEVIADS